MALDSGVISAVDEALVRGADEADLADRRSVRRLGVHERSGLPCVRSRSVQWLCVDSPSCFFAVFAVFVYTWETGYRVFEEPAQETSSYCGQMGGMQPVESTNIPKIIGQTLCLKTCGGRYPAVGPPKSVSSGEGWRGVCRDEFACMGDCSGFIDHTQTTTEQLCFFILCLRQPFKPL